MLACSVRMKKKAISKGESEPQFVCLGVKLLIGQAYNNLSLDDIQRLNAIR